MAAREAFLASEGLTDSLDSVESLIKKHEDFDKALSLQEQKINAIESFAQQLINNDHYDAPAIGTKRDQVLER